MHNFCEGQNNMATVTDPYTAQTTTDNFSNYNYEYDYDYEDQRCNKTDVIQFGELFTPVFFSIVVILSVFGNILVLVILVKFETLKSLTNTFILNLALSDLFFTASLPFWAYHHMHSWSLGDAACKIVYFIFYVGFYSSGILLMLMTAHRYVAVMNPLSDIVSTSGIYSILASAVIWVTSILLSSPVFKFTKVESNYCGYENSDWGLSGIYLQNVLFILISLVFIFCYSQIVIRLLRPNAQKRRRGKTLKLIFILMLVFFVGWVPYNVVIFLQALYMRPQELHQSLVSQYCETSKRLDYAFQISRILAFSQCCLNPVFYVFVGVKFRTHMKKMLKTWDRRRNNNSSIRSTRSRYTITSITSGEELSL
ncbi:chemokine XC receptor 1-like [Pholidichthys leucotaenia]